MKNGQPATYRVVALEMDGTRTVLETGRTQPDAARLQAIFHESGRYRVVMVEEEEPPRQPPPDP